jgi:hypothetical protein
MKAAEESHRLTDRLVSFYNWILRHKQGWMKYLYWVMNKIGRKRAIFFNAAASVT